MADIVDGPRRKSRNEQLTEILADHASVFETLADEREVHWFGFSGGACSEPRLIEMAYAFEQATLKRVPPPDFR